MKTGIIKGDNLIMDAKTNKYNENMYIEEMCVKLLF